MNQELHMSSYKSSFDIYSTWIRQKVMRHKIHSVLHVISIHMRLILNQLKMNLGVFSPKMEEKLSACVLELVICKIKLQDPAVCIKTECQPVLNTVNRQTLWKNTMNLAKDNPNKDTIIKWSSIHNLSSTNKRIYDSI